VGLELALTALRLGLCPVPPKEDGSKAPLGLWKEYQTNLPSRTQLDGMYADGLSGIGLVLGAVSGHVEMLDFDTMDAYEAFVRRAQRTGLGDLVARIEAGYLEATPKPGRHWLWRCEPAGTCTKLARRPATPEELAVNPDDRIKTLIETKSEGGYGIIAPTNGKVHPNGGAYKLLSGSLETIATITVLERQDLLDLARSFDVVGHQKAAKAPVAPVGGRPGDEWAARTPWEEIVADWPVVARSQGVLYLRRPGKTAGISATINFGGSDLLYVFTSSTEFEQHQSYTKFGAYAVLHHGGDHRAAAQALASRGFGDQKPVRGHLALVQPQAGGVRLRYDNQIGRRKVEFLWRPRIPRGEVTLLVGDPDQGKSFVSLALAAALSNGVELPDSTGVTTGRTAVIAFEDDPETTITPRYDALGGRPGFLPILDYRYEDGTNRVLDVNDLAGIRTALLSVEDLVLVIIDPLSNLMTGMNQDRTSEVRAVLTRVVAMARELNVAIVALMHMNKADMANALYRVSGAGAFVQVARSVLLAGTHPETGRRYLTHPKHNLSVGADALEYVLSEREGFMWGEIDGEVTPEKLLERRNRQRGATRGERLVLELLADGARRAADIEAAATEAGIPARTLYRSAHSLGVNRDRIGFGGEVWWSLPAQ
jgi:hypothetical protein